jgi:hypothetical protein
MAALRKFHPGSPVVLTTMVVITTYKDYRGTDNNRWGHYHFASRWGNDTTGQ